MFALLPREETVQGALGDQQGLRTTEIRDLRSSLPSPGGETGSTNQSQAPKATGPLGARAGPGVPVAIPGSVHGLFPLSWTVFSQVDSSWGPGSLPRPHVCWGGNSKVLNFPGEVTRIDSEISPKSKPILASLPGIITGHQCLGVASQALSLSAECP